MRFKDAQGTKWNVSIDVGKLEEIRDRLEIDVGSMEKFIEHASNLIDLANMLYVICEEQATQRGISDEEFGRRLVGEAFDRGLDAITKSYASFLPRRQRQRLEAILSAIDRSQEVGDQVVKQMIQELEKQKTNGTYSRSATSWPEFAAGSIHDRLSSGN